MEKSPELVRRLADVASRRLLSSQLIKAMAETYPEVDREALNRFQHYGVWRTLERGEVLFERGDDTDGCYVVVIGSLLAIERRPDGPPQVRGEILNGELIGEMALLSGSARGATVVARRKSILFHLSKEAFERVLERSPRALSGVARTLIERLEDGSSKSRPLMAPCFGIVPAVSPGEAEAFAQKLSAGLSKLGSTLLVTPESLRSRGLLPSKRVSSREMEGRGSARPSWCSCIRTTRACRPARPGGSTFGRAFATTTYGSAARETSSDWPGCSRVER